MSKRIQLLIALVGLLLAASLLAILFIVILSGRDYPTMNIPQASATLRIAPRTSASRPMDRYAGREDDALRRIWRRRAFVPGEQDASRPTIRQVVETDLFQPTLQSLFCCDRLQRVGWRAFRLEESVYEVQFNYQDLAVEFGPAWIVQMDPDGLQPPDSGGVVPANVFADIVQSGVSDEVERFLNRENEVILALTNHRFALGARLGSALLLYFQQRKRANAGEAALVGWTVVPERIQPGEATFYRAFFQWIERGRPRFAQWEVNLDTHEFRGLNLLASDIMATGDRIDTYQLTPIKPQNLEQAERDNPRSARPIQAARRIVDDERIIEAIAAYLWDQTQSQVSIEYPAPPTVWESTPVPDLTRVYDVKYLFTENGENRCFSFRVDLNTNRVQPVDDLAWQLFTILNPVRWSPQEIPGYVHPRPAPISPAEEPPQAVDSQQPPIPPEVPSEEPPSAVPSPAAEGTGLLQDEGQPEGSTDEIDHTVQPEEPLPPDLPEPPAPPTTAPDVTVPQPGGELGPEP
ncbi:MAG: hypothetical protein JW797_18030 [Bradymonadales bacterium]|nr:hypothetical protein [Bradymonadales bacterium]